jgi:hypothetical protein
MRPLDPVIAGIVEQAERRGRMGLFRELVVALKPLSQRAESTVGDVLDVLSAMLEREALDANSGQRRPFADGHA